MIAKGQSAPIRVRMTAWYVAVLALVLVAVGAFVIAGHTLVAIHKWTFLLGPGWVVGIGALLFGVFWMGSKA